MLSCSQASCCSLAAPQDFVRRSAGATTTLTQGGSDELVKVGGSPTLYRARAEGGFVKYTWTDYAGDGHFGYWTAELPNGTKRFFGASAKGKTVPESRTDGVGGTYAYNLVEEIDANGHSIRYAYTKDQGMSYLSAIEWVDGYWGPRYQVTLAYGQRPDALVDGKSGVEITLAKRLTDVRVMVKGQLLRHYYLQYEGDGLLSRLAYFWTYGSDDVSIYPARLAFKYSGSFDPTCEKQSTCNLPYIKTVTGSVGGGLANGNADLIDINGDGIPDVVDTTDGKHRFYLGRLDAKGNHSFDPPIDSKTSGSGAMSLKSPYVTMVDLNGDGFSDMVDTLNRRVLWGTGKTEWTPGALPDGILPDVSNPNARFLDTDHDGKIDSYYCDGSNAWVMRSDGTGHFEQGEILEPLDWSTSQGMRFADMNGDGLPDPVLVAVDNSITSVTYRAHLGHGVFGSKRVEMFLPKPIPATQLDLVDLNGDGLADAVYVAGNVVQYALNINGQQFGPLQKISAVSGGSIPERTTGVQVRFADMNASGSTDIVWITADGKVTYLELFPKRANLLTQVTNGLGKVNEIYYGTSAAHMARDGGPEKWSWRLPHVNLTVDRVVLYDLQTNVKQIQDLHYSSGYWDGKERQFRGYAHVEVSKTGDASVESVLATSDFEVGQFDPDRRGLLLRDSLASAGKVIKTSEHTYDDCQVWGVDSKVTPRVRYICQTKAEETILEGRPEAEWVKTRTVTEYDCYGNVTLSQNQGVVSIGGKGCAACTRDPAAIQGEPCGPQCLGDEKTEETTYVTPLPGKWILHAPQKKLTYGSDKAQAAEELTYYDGPAYQGLALGQLTRGRPTRVSKKVNVGGDERIDSERLSYGDDGQVIGVMDPNGNERWIGYDENNLHPVYEDVVFPGYRLRQALTLHSLYEQPIESTDWIRMEGDQEKSARRATQYRYDEFGRLSAIALPGDEIASPTQEFAYELNSPISRIIARTRSQKDGPFDIEAIQCFDGMGRKFQEGTLLGDGKYQLNGFQVFNIQGKPSRTYQPYTSSNTCPQTPPSDVRYTETGYDGVERAVWTTMPDASIYGTASRVETRFRPLVQEGWDSEDLDPQSPHKNTPTTTRMDGLGRKVRLERLLTPTDKPLVTTFFYDPLGAFRSIADDAGNERISVNDLLGRMVEVRDPDAGTAQNFYDAAGNLVRSVDATGKVGMRSYDAANRLTAIWDGADKVGTASYFAYDGGPEQCDPSQCTNVEGKLVGTSCQLEPGLRGVDQIAYDVRGLTTWSMRKIGKASFEFGTEYDNASRPVATTYPGGRRIERQYDQSGRLVAIPGYVRSVAYNAQGLTANFVLGNQTRTDNRYDDILRLSSLTTTGPKGSTVQDYRYTRDRVGNLTAIDDGRSVGAAITDKTAQASYSYDAIYRLTGANLDKGMELTSYVYDRIDNIVSKTSNLGGESAEHVGTYAYGQAGAGPHAVTRAGDDFFRYDAAGRMSLGRLNHYQWDFQGRLTQARFGNARIANFGYGPGPERVLKREGSSLNLYVAGDFEFIDGIATTYVKIGANRVAKIEEAAKPEWGQFPADRDRDGSITCADAAAFEKAKEAGDRVDEVVAMAARQYLLGADSATTYIHQNHIGSSAVTTDAAGAVLQRTEHYPYGAPRHVDGYLEQYSFTGQERDDSSGLQYNLTRYYNSRLGGWISPDSLFLEDPAMALARKIHAALKISTEC